uniref:Neuropeptide n=1 Tax=Panagrellus redivivus TaxID=6233 RepID=A0A7E4VZY6_PANRE
MSRTTVVCTYVFMAVLLLGVVAEARAQAISPGSFTDFRFYRLFGLRPQNNNRESSKRSLFDGDDSESRITAKRGGSINKVRGNERYWLGFGKRSYGDLEDQ